VAHLCNLSDLRRLKLMRLKASSIAVIFVLAITTTAVPSISSNVRASILQTQTPPRIIDVRVKGRKLILTGENFSDGAVVLLNGEPQKTRNDEGSSSTILIAKKAGNNIPDGSAVNIQVESTGGLSDKFAFFKGTVVTLDDASKTIHMRVGERILLVLLTTNGYDFVPSVVDETILRKVADAEIPGSQGVYEALRPGSTKLAATGELPCHRTTPRCLAPTLFVEFTIVVD
jgi:hypothetical protein